LLETVLESEQVINIAKALCENKTLTNLLMTGINIGRDSAAEFNKCFKINTTLQKLRLSRQEEKEPILSSLDNKRIEWI